MDPNPYAPPASDVRRTRTLDRSTGLGWRIYAFAFTVFLIPGYVSLIRTGLRAVFVVDAVLSVVGLVGLFAFAYRKPLLRPRFWLLWAVLLSMWDVAFNFVLYVPDGSSTKPVATALSLLPVVPEYVALGLYAFSRSLWAPVDQTVRADDRR